MHEWNLSRSRRCIKIFEDISFTIWQSSCPKIPLKSELFDIFQTTLQYLSDYTVKIPV